MASTYALPVSLPHSHMNSPSHPRSHSHSLSPSKLGPGIQKASNSKALRQERSSGTLHSHVHSSSVHDHSHSHSHDHGPATSIDSNPSQYNDVTPGQQALKNHSHSHSISKSQYANDEKAPSTQAHDHQDHSYDDHHDHHHEHHQRFHDHSHDLLRGSNHSHKTPEPRSRVTNFLLKQADSSSLLHSILVEKDSRRIFYFMTLNFAFMAVQAFYGFVTDSLGLLSDSVHMFFDCLALALGLFAAVASKWPPSQRFPYGLGKIESLSGFGNGVFLMLISIEIMIEAAERIVDGHVTKRLTELFVVSTLGLLVNLVGMACFGHHHYGHDHSHGGHDHCHDSHAHNHKHEHKNSHNHGHGVPSLTVQATTGHSHDQENENMRGIYLHVLADTMGSAAVIVSTLLMSTVGWAGWDPLASILIAALIFLSSIPLVTSCAKKLLLTVPDDTEYQLRNTLAGISGLRGVASYHVPRFWMVDKSGEGEAKSVLGVMHIIAMRGTDIDDLRERARSFLSSSGIDAVIQVEREGDGKCWCGGDSGRSPSPPTSRYS